MIEKIKKNINEGYVNICNVALVQSILMVYIPCIMFHIILLFANS